MGIGYLIHGAIHLKGMNRVLSFLIRKAHRNDQQGRKEEYPSHLDQERDLKYAVRIGICGVEPGFGSKKARKEFIEQDGQDDSA